MILQHPSTQYLHTMAHLEDDVDDDSCNTALRLAPSYHHQPDHHQSSCDGVNTIEKRCKKSVSSLSLSLLSSPEGGKNEPSDQLPRNSRATSNSNSNSSGIKRENQSCTGGDEEIQRDIEKDRVCSRLLHVSDEDEEPCSPRKKLRLSKEQTLVLEDCFKLHTTLNPKQKEDLAKQLNLRPRQVEVWFQNRRARTKLKQTEVDCEMLKKHCETLKEENRRLQKELQELKALKQTTSLYMKLPAATLSMCPSCERIANSNINSTSDGSTKPTPKIFSSTGSKSSIISLM